MLPLIWREHELVRWLRNRTWRLFEDATKTFPLLGWCVRIYDFGLLWLPALLAAHVPLPSFVGLSVTSLSIIGHAFLLPLSMTGCASMFMELDRTTKLDLIALASWQ